MKICFRKRIEELQYVQRKLLKALIQEIEKLENQPDIFLLNFRLERSYPLI